MGVAASTDRVHGVLDNSAGRKIQVCLEHEHTYTLMDTHRSTSTLALKLLESFFFFFFQFGWDANTNKNSLDMYQNNSIGLFEVLWNSIKKIL